MRRRRSVTAMVVAAASVLVGVNAGAQPPGALPNVHVVGTGGTIAGEQFEPGTLGRYDPKKPVSEIVASVPVVRRYANVSSEQFVLSAVRVAASPESRGKGVLVVMDDRIPRPPTAVDAHSRRCWSRAT